MLKKILFSITLLMSANNYSLGRFGYGLFIGITTGTFGGLYGSKCISWATLEMLDQMKDTKLKRGLLRELIAFIKRREENSQCSYNGYSELREEAEKMLNTLNKELQQPTPVNVPLENDKAENKECENTTENNEFVEQKEIVLENIDNINDEQQN